VLDKLLEVEDSDDGYYVPYMYDIECSSD